MAIGLFGGAFDPVHNTHVRIAGEAVRQARLDRLLVVPNACPPHRGSSVAPIADRLSMLRIAMGDMPGVEVSAIEGDQGDPHYMIDTVRRLQVRHPDTHIVLVVGADVMAVLDEWRQWRELIGMCGWLVVPREGHVLLREARRVLLDELGRLVVPEAAAKRAGCAALLEMGQSDDASNVARKGLRQGNACCGMIPPGVLGYIRESRLYE